MSRRPSHRELSFASAVLAKRILTPDEMVRATIEWSNQVGDQPLDQWLLDRAAISETDAIELRSQLKATSVEEGAGADHSDDGDDSLDLMRQALAMVDDPELKQTVAFLNESLNDADDGDAKPPVIPDSARFEIREQLARGGLGEVFVARDKQLNRSVAPVSYTHLTLPTITSGCRSRWSPYH